MAVGGRVRFLRDWAISLDLQSTSLITGCRRPIKVLRLLTRLSQGRIRVDGNNLTMTDPSFVRIRFSY